MIEHNCVRELRLQVGEQADKLAAFQQVHILRILLVSNKNYMYMYLRI